METKKIIGIIIVVTFLLTFIPAICLAGAPGWDPDTAQQVSFENLHAYFSITVYENGDEECALIAGVETGGTSFDAFISCRPIDGGPWAPPPSY